MAEGVNSYIFWTSVCGNKTIYDTFWNRSFTLDTYQPDLTECFQKTAVTWVTCGLLWFAFPLYAYFLSSWKLIHPWKSISRLNLMKMIVISLLAATNLVVLIYCLILNTDGDPTTQPTIADYSYVIIKLSTYILAGILTRWSFRKGEHSSGPLFIFWLLQLIVVIVAFRSGILRIQAEGSRSAMYELLISCVELGLIGSQFVMSTFADVAALKSPRTLCQAINGDSGHARLIDAASDDSGVTPGEKTCPVVTASFLSKIYFTWFFPTLIRGYRQPLTYDDIWDTQPANSSVNLLPKFEEAWRKEEENVHEKSSKRRHLRTGIKHKGYGGIDDTSNESQNSKHSPIGNKADSSVTKRRPSLVRALTRMFGLYYIPAGLLVLGMDLTMILNPLLLEQLIEFVEARDKYSWQGYLIAFTMFVASSINILFFVHFYNVSYTAVLRCRTALTSAIYRKSLRLSSAARKYTAAGEIVNLMSVDVEKIVQMFTGLHFFWSAPLFLVFSMYFQYQILGPACLTGLLVVLIVIPMNSALLAMQIKKLQKEQMVLKDHRIKLVNQVLSGIKVLKLYAWEPHFRDKILKIRAEELKKLRQVAFLSAATFSLWFMAPFLVAVMDFLVFVFVEEKTLTPQVAFTTLSLIVAQNLQFNLLPQFIMWLAQAVVSVRRIEKFFSQPEIDEDIVTSDLSEESAILVENGTFSWGEEDRTPLKDIILRVPAGSLVAVVGQVGAGKSSLVSAILGEMEKVNGRVIVNGTVAYVPQQAWIQNLTLRDNVLFSRPFNSSRYDAILEACALKPDLATLPGGDLTEIGERGINLSGGQKQRVSLARAVYQDTRIYLMDDPLSAVDSHVGKHIFKHVIGPNGLLKDKTRLLVTHSITHLHQMDLIVVMKDGFISEIGGYDELLGHQGAFSEFINTYLTENPEELSDADPEDLEALAKLQHLVSTSDDGDSFEDKPGSNLGQKIKKRTRKKSTSSKISVGSSCSVRTEQEKQVIDQNKLIEEETSEEGTVNKAVLKAYAKAVTAKMCVLTLFSLAAYTASLVITNIWLSEWTNDSSVELQATENGTSASTPSPNMRLAVYGALGGLQMISVFMMSVTVAIGAVSASRVLHSALLHKIVRCPMSFFDTTPIGRILNRFSKDVDIMDTNIQYYLLNIFLIGGPLLTIFIIIAYTTPIFIIAFIPITVTFTLLQRFYVRCSTQIKRIDSVKKSPVYAFFSETLTGTNVIRAYKQQSRFIKHSDSLVDDSQKVYFELFTANRWVNIYTEVIGDLVVLFAGIFAVLQRENINPSLAGLSLTFALQVSFNLVFLVRHTCDLETYIVSVERIKEYADLVPEAPWVLPKRRPPSNWPKQGSIDFKSYQTRYREGMELVLKDVTCHIASGEKVGVVGRTGAGKSSLTLGLFRVLEAAGGRIDIDGMDISDMGLHDLRTKLTIIPQDPVLFSGSLRFNLDPAEKHTDDEIWLSLEQAHLKSFVETLPDTLLYECGENGENMSLGQRQLVCLARALLRKTQILVLDEATAAVDMETDDLIQSTIRSEFKASTVITIAHRINTILDYDRVIVMADGNIAEIDSPDVLRNDKASVFYAMAKDAGIV